MTTYKKDFIAGWAEMDSNSHMRNTAFLDRSADVRMMFFSEHGFPVKEFMQQNFGPVVSKDEIEYFREVHILGKFTVNFLLAGLSLDGSRMRLRNEFYLADSTLVARVNSTGGWLDLQKRKLVAPPGLLVDTLNQLTKTTDFIEMPSSIKS